MTMNWNLDMLDAPRPGYGDRKEHGDILVAIAGTNKMTVTHWVPQDYANLTGRWAGLQPDEAPLAWCDIEHPMPPKAATVTPPVGVVLPAGIPGIS